MQFSTILSLQIGDRKKEARMRERQLMEAEQMHLAKEQFGADFIQDTPETKMTNTLGEEPTNIEIELEEKLQVCNENDQ